ncbi:hypothetical protein [Haloarcula sp. 1CSR25-25]|uniref:hypothetical protein n=1 Tax=Haloarcula sp. 1CSR25-25 TaxID=2862545 RepID=UPI002896002C|nr:hypothetical protein [Haloarcula sp. 1CSR25-25]MDT3434693.1 hypothetical protein [Haloarcula sp. 1CSR25-25]
MGISWTKDDDDWDGAHSRRVRLTGAFDTSYTSGGEPLTPSDADLGSIESVTVLSPSTESGYVVRYDHDTDEVLLFQEDASAGPLAEVAGSTDVSTETVAIEVRGRS